MYTVLIYSYFIISTKWSGVGGYTLEKHRYYKQISINITSILGKIPVVIEIRFSVMSLITNYTHTVYIM